MADALDPGHLIGHVKDAEYFELPRTLVEGGKLRLPQFRPAEEPVYQLQTGVKMLDSLVEPLDLRLTKFMVLEVVAAVLVATLFIWLAGRLSSGRPPRGRLWNLLEAMLLFLRNEVARPAIGKHDADRFLPFLWTVFFFILACNLLGMVPWMGSPTGALGATGALALVTFGVVVGSGTAKMGVVGFWTGQVPHMKLPLVLAIFLIPMIFAIEVLGLCIKHFVLSVRLLANMMAGHLVLTVLLAFVAAVGATVSSYFHPLFLGVSMASILGATALSLLELFVAFLQAYIFTFLSALFIGMAVHPH
jgi:F-type H+-transporting ATPase subunit a